MPTQLDAGVFAERTYLEGLCHLADRTWVHLSVRKGGRKIRRVEPGMPESESAELEAWPEQLGHLGTAEGPWADVVVFHEPCHKEDAFLPLVARLAEALVADRDEGVGHWIRNIRLVKTRRTNDGFMFG